MENYDDMTQQAVSAEVPAAEQTAAQQAAETQPAAHAPAPDGRSMRKTVNHVFLWILIYNALQMVVASLLSLAGNISVFRNNGSSLLSDSGFQMIAATCLCAGLVFLCTSKKWKVNPFKKGTKKMTAKDFFLLFCVFSISQIITLLAGIITSALGIEGTSIDLSMTASLLIYASFTGPFIEEVMYRGFAEGTLDKKGRIAAIVLSAMAFGLMHANLSQFIVAMISGLLLGYVFSEYSIWWTLLIHVINNSVGSVCKMFVPADYVDTAGMIVYAVFGIFSVVGIIAMIRRRAEVKAWFVKPENHMSKADFKGIFSSVWMYIFVLVYLAIIVFMMMFPNLASMLGK